MKILTAQLLAVLLLFGFGLERVAADPPPWAPAHGYRAQKKDKRYRHDDHVYYGVLDGRCNREAIGAVLGGTVGGVVGREVIQDKTLGTVAGVIVGAVLGGMLGRTMDEADRHCTGHVLEYVEDGRRVRWSDPKQRVEYYVTPINTYGSNASYCREFTVTRVEGRKRTEERGIACRNPDGTWRTVR
jgi:surface antigen